MTGPGTNQPRTNQTLPQQASPWPGTPRPAPPRSPYNGVGPLPGAQQRAQPRPPAPPAVHLKIDWTKCDGRGLCVEILPELLAQDPWGYPVARNGAGPGTKMIGIPAAMLEHADLAIESCPRLAIIKIVEGGK